MTDDDEPPRPPRAGVPNLTKVDDTGTGRDLLEVEGTLTLPIGARIELGSAMDPRARDAIVTRVRLWARRAGAQRSCSRDAPAAGKDTDLPQNGRAGRGPLTGGRAWAALRRGRI